MVKRTIKRTAQRTPSLLTEQGAKDSKEGTIAPRAKLSTYMKTREALFRLLASYPPDMTVAEAIRRAKQDFTKGKEVSHD